ncbi:hypothetical protein NKG94_32610 [Micromonospora sp. M12]
MRRVTGSDVPANCWRFVAELPGGELVGELRAHARTPCLEYGEWYLGVPEWEMVLDGCSLPPAAGGWGLAAAGDCVDHRHARGGHRRRGGDRRELRDRAAARLRLRDRGPPALRVTAESPRRRDA